MYKKIQRLRPPYRIINPLGFWISVAFVPFNLFLGIYLLNIPLHSLELPLLQTFGWGIIYVIIGLWLALALKKDKLKLIRWAMLAGLFIKIYFMSILFLLAIDDGFLHDLYILDLWGLVALVQALVIIFFVPREVIYNDRNRSFNQ